MEEVFPKALGSASWMWPSELSDMPNQFVQFRQEFALEHIKSVPELYISADSNYAVWINGRFIATGQYHDYPQDKTFDLIRLDDILQEGTNAICVLLYYQGETSFQYIKGCPGLIFAIDMGNDRVVSDRDTYYRVSPSYGGGSIARINRQMGFTFEYHAEREDAWTSLEYAIDHHWKSVGADGVSCAEERRLRPRPIHKLVVKGATPARIVAQGMVRRANDESSTVAALMQSDYLSPRTAEKIFLAKPPDDLSSRVGVELRSIAHEGDCGMYLVIDIGREEAGFFELDVDAKAGTVIDIGHGEHLDDLRVRTSVGGRNFANRYVCKAGRQVFTHYFNRFAGRYIQLHIWGGDGLVLYYTGLRPTEYPVEYRGAFCSSDHIENRINQIAVRTLHLCMHEHYEDCPWREQALYAMDSRNQALCGYYAFGEYDFPAASFSLLGDGLNDDGYLELCAPSEIEITIPSFSMAWIMAQADLLMFSGNLESAKQELPRVARMLELYHRNISGYLLPSPQGERYWHFYDWAPGLSGNIDEDATDFGVLSETRWDAPLNLFYCLALESGALLAENCGYAEGAQVCRVRAGRLRKAFHRKFWDEEKELYRTYIGGGVPEHYSELVQSLAILAGVCPAEIASHLRDRLVSPDNDMVETTLSQSLYKFEALMGEPDRYAAWVFEKIAADWGDMLNKGATSFWETIKGGDDFDNAGSLCHGWSGIPVYFYMAYLLGVKPVEPGFRSFSVRPMYAGFRQVEGRIPTPYGPIDVTCTAASGKVQVEVQHPASIRRQ